MAKYGRRKSLQMVVLLIAAAIVWFLDQRNPEKAGKTSSKPPPSATATYETFSGCQLVEHRQNDGDSFRVKLPDGRVEEFRLYYVDAPESDFRTYGGGKTNRERIHEQAQEFGITDEQAVAIGKKAKKLIHDILSRGSFTVQTKWDDPFNDRRYHAFVTPASGPLLEEMLVREGLVRIYTKPAPLPDGTAVKTQLGKLHQLEAEAKRSQRGGWALSR